VSRRVVVDLAVAAERSFRCQKAANSLDIDIAAKLAHHFEIDCEIDAPYNVGVIVGASGSGKTSLARQLWGDEALARTLDGTRPVIDQFPDEMDYDDCVRLLSGVGLTQVPCWIRPAWTLSNGQRERAEIALKMARAPEHVVIDEWTSVVDRTVGKVMSFCVQKWARATKRRVVLVTCHRDVLEWLDPDWIIDCDKRVFDDRRSLRPTRAERLTFEARECERSTWHAFSRYHYLSEKLPGGIIRTFGLYHGDDQIGFQCFANYVPNKYAGRAMQMHSNRTVVHPDYVGFGLGMWLINCTSKLMHDEGYDVRAKFSSLPVFRAMSRDPNWVHYETSRRHKVIAGANMVRKGGFRLDVTTYSFKFAPRALAELRVG
jgi:energy-coupling factor transporter ATP-binding protein EcfA2